MAKPNPPAFDPLDVPESNQSRYPEQYRAAHLLRHNRRLGDHAGLKNFGVNLTRVAPGGRSSQRHAHSRQDEFIYVLDGEATLETNTGPQILRPGMCVGFPAGVANGHQFVNRSAAPARYLEVGTRDPEDRATYCDVDLAYGPLVDGDHPYVHKDGTPY